MELNYGVPNPVPEPLFFTTRKVFRSEVSLKVEGSICYLSNVCNTSYQLFRPIPFCWFFISKISTTFIIKNVHKILRLWILLTQNLWVFTRSLKAQEVLVKREWVTPTERLYQRNHTLKVRPGEKKFRVSV